MSVLVSLLLSFVQLDFTREQQDIIVRMSGCPNGCSRPWLGEIAFVGRSNAGKSSLLNVLLRRLRSPAFKCEQQLLSSEAAPGLPRGCAANHP